MALHISLLLLSVFLYLRFYDLGTLCKLRSHFINILLRRAAPAFDGSYFCYAILTFVCNSLSSCVSHIVLFHCAYFLPEHTPLHVERKDDLENGICETVTGSQEHRILTLSFPDILCWVKYKGHFEYEELSGFLQCLIF